MSPTASAETTAKGPPVPPPPVVPLPSADPAETELEEPVDNDPRFATCTEAKEHGYGPYRKGVDPEYGWYVDRDSDGVVCE